MDQQAPPSDSALRRLPLVGRGNELKEIERLRQQVVRRGRPAIYYLEGTGGIGKTALLEEALRRARGHRGKEWLIPEMLLDLYHTDYQTPLGLAQGLDEVLARPHALSAYRDKVSELQRRAQSGTVSGEAWQEAWGLLTKGLSKLAEQRGLVLLALDTAEVIEYAQDDFQRQLGTLPSMASVGTWLLEEILPHVHGPVLWLLAGRPTALGRQLEELAKRGEVEFGRRGLDPLMLKEAMTYVRGVTGEIERGDPEGARRLRNYLERYAEGLYRCTGGAPIRLAMVADIVRAGGELPSLCYATHTSDTRAVGGDALDELLLRHLLDVPDPIGSVLRTMAWLRKGCNRSLLARLNSISEDEAGEHLKAAGKLVLVKRRPQGDRPYFLHDEIYALFDRYALTEQRGRRIFPAVIAHYEAMERKAVEALRKVSPLVADVTWRPRLRALRAEQLHYRLRENPRRGFEAYFRWAEDALAGREREMDMILRSELLRTAREMRMRLPDDLRRQIEVDAAIRWGMRALFLEGKPGEAAQLFRQVRRWIGEKEGRRATTHALGAPARWHLRLYEAVAAMRRGEYEMARQNLEGIRAELEEGSRGDGAAIVDVLLALTEGYLGYLERLRGTYYQAVRHYQAAAVRFRRLKMGILTTTLSNLAYAMAMVGRFRRARQALDEAEQYANRERQAYRLAVALNVRCIVEAMDGHSRTAIRHASDALHALERAGIEDHRLQALIHTNRARAYRYYWNSLVAEGRWREGWKDSLWQAYEDVKKARNRFKWAGVPAENPYYLEMANEAGCIYREMAWVHRRLQEEGGPFKGRSAEGESYEEAFRSARGQAAAWLKAAAGLQGVRGDLGEQGSPGWEAWKEAVERRIAAVGGDPYLPTLALVNLGWHWHYQREKAAQIAALCDLVEQLLPSEYHLPAPQIEREEAHIMLWSVLGKMEMLRFHQSLREREEAPDGAEMLLRRGMRAAVYALEYNHLMGDMTYDLQRAEIGLNQRLLSLPNWETLLPDLYRLEEEIARGELEGFLARRGKARTTFRRWLEERFGDKSLWV